MRARGVGRAGVRGARARVRRGATTWWMTRLSCYEAMPHQPGTINADHCVWDTIYEEEYLPEMAIAGVPGGSLSTWKEGKARALQQFADLTYGDELNGRPCVLKMRSSHSAFKECTDCQDLRLMYRNALRNRVGTWRIEEIKAEIQRHRRWWMEQRQELERLRLKGGRWDILFTQSDGCGEDCLNQPSVPI